MQLNVLDDPAEAMKALDGKISTLKSSFKTCGLCLIRTCNAKDRHAPLSIKSVQSTRRYSLNTRVRSGVCGSIENGIMIMCDSRIRMLLGIPVRVYRS
jgi:hypothetical protein